MPKVTLDRGWTYERKMYGPGEVDLPDDVHAALKERGAFEPQAAAADPATAEYPIGADMQEIAPLAGSPKAAEQAEEAAAQGGAEQPSGKSGGGKRPAADEGGAA